MTEEVVTNAASTKRTILSHFNIMFTVKILGVAISAVTLVWAIAWMVVEQSVERRVAALQREIPGLVEETLRSNGEIIRDVLAASQANEARQQAERRRTLVREAVAEILRVAENPVRGNPNGDVTIIEFFDVRCPFCRRLHGELEETMRRDDMIKVVMRDLPILGPQSLLASQALLAARNQNGYERLYHRLMAFQGDVTEDALRSIVEDLGMDWRRLRSDMDDPAVRSWIDGNVAIAQRLSISGTPALLIGDELVIGAIDREAIQRLVATARRRN